MKHYVFDTFALTAYVLEEDGSDIVAGILKSIMVEKATVSMSCVNLGEFFYICTRKFGEERATIFYEFYKQFPINRIPADEEMCLVAAKYKAGNVMSYADGFALALAKKQSAILVTGDPEFKPFAKEVEILWLPEKKKATKKK